MSKKRTTTTTELAKNAATAGITLLLIVLQGSSSCGGSNMPPLAFHDEMLDRLTNAAALLPSNARDGFMRSVANRISDPPYPAGIAELETAIRFVLGTRGVTGGYGAFTNKTTNKVVARARADRQFARR
jgi:hypothetical protein